MLLKGFYICIKKKSMLSFENTEIAFRYKTNSDLSRARMLFTAIANPGLVKMGKSLTYFAQKRKENHHRHQSIFR